MINTNPMWRAESYFNYIMELSHAFQKSRVLFAAIELDLFTVLGDLTLNSAELADKLNTDVRALDRLLNSLTALGFIEKKGARFCNTEPSKKHLVKGEPEYIGSLMYVVHQWDKWSDLTGSIKSGGPITYQSINDKSDKWVEEFVNSQHWQALHEAPDVIKLLKFSSVKKVLDLGCGSGIYSALIAKENPSVDVYAYDYPKVIKQTKRLLEKESVLSKVNTLEGDFTIDDFGSGYDMVILSNVCYYFSIWDNINLLQRIYDSMNRGGTIVIHQPIIEDDRVHTMQNSMLALSMLVNTVSGDAYTETDVWIMLKEAWFQDIMRINTEFGTSIITAKKTSMF